MKAVDAVNRKLGRKTLYFGTQDAGVRHYVKREFKMRLLHHFMERPAACTLKCIIILTLF